MELTELLQKIDMVWVLMAAILVFAMQLGFALVETVSRGRRTRPTSS
jgi:ammonia channel protein AmtB